MLCIRPVRSVVGPQQQDDAMVFCPSDEQLSQLLEEQLNDDELAIIVLHLEHCEECQELLEELTRDRLALDTLGDLSEELGGIGLGVRPLACDLDSTMGDFPFDDTADFLLESLPRPKRMIPNRPHFSEPGGTRPKRPATPVPVAPVNKDDWPEVEGYELLSRLGFGGMGVVYKARHKRLNRLVALKMIRAGSQARPEQLARFRLEAEAVAQMRHANVVQIYDIGEVDGLPYFALELLEGGSLEAKVAGTPQPERQAAELVETLARAIQAAHAVGIVHRDLKSSNVLFGRDLTPRITDFGLAKRLDEEQGHTETGQVMGSPSFMAPEQARGRGRDVGPAADVYALGAILFEMLTGRPPFKGATPMDTLIQVIHEDPVAPSQLRPRMSRDLETICLKCLAKEPYKRYATAADLADDLGRYLAGRPIQARRTSLRERGLKWVRRKPAAAALALLSAAAALGVLSLGLVYLQQLRRDEARLASLRLEGGTVLLHAREALGRQKWAEGIARLNVLREKIWEEPRLARLQDDTRRLLHQIEQGELAQREKEEAHDRYMQFLQLRDEALFLDTNFMSYAPAEQLQATRKAARAALNLYASAGQEETWRPCSLPISLSKTEQSDVKESCYEVLLVLAEAVSQSLAGENRANQTQQALRILDCASRLRTPSRGYRLRRAAILELAGETQSAERERAEADRTQPATAFDHFLTGKELYKRRDWPGAISHFERALRLDDDHFWAHALLAICQLQTKRPSEARAELSRCIQRQTRFAWLYLLRGFAYGEEAHQAAESENPSMAKEPAASALVNSKYETAEDDYRKALSLHPVQSERYAVFVNRGIMRIHRRSFGEAIADLRSAVDLNPRLFMAYTALAQAYQQQGQVDDAILELTHAIECKPDEPALYRSRALAQLERKPVDRGSREAALSDLERAIQLSQPGQSETAADHTKRAQLLQAARRYQDALTSAERALSIRPHDAEAHRAKLKALLELRRYNEVIGACDGYLAQAPASAEVLVIRGLAKAGKHDYPGAVLDYTQAVALQPDRPALLAHRGWAYLVSEAPKLALLDFNEAIRLDPNEGDCYTGRGFAKAVLGDTPGALGDAEKSLTLGAETPRKLYNAARVFAQVAATERAAAARRGVSLLSTSEEHLERAQKLLLRALDSLEVSQRIEFWKEVVQSDPALQAVRRRPRLAQMVASWARLDP
jgi:tetratricopeptide (TPR) repeat protein/tRNA A-37 threonylcarbamoyl transferase component Bud32